MKNLRSEIIKYSKMLNLKKLSALRSGNISSRYKDGFLITPSGKKYSTLKNNDIVFVSLNGYFDKKKGIPSSEWKFHQEIYRKKKRSKSNCSCTLNMRYSSFYSQERNTFFSLYGSDGWRS